MSSLNAEVGLSVEDVSTVVVCRLGTTYSEFGVFNTSEEELVSVDVR